MKKIKLLAVGIIMNCAGTEKAFLSFLSAIDREKYDVTLLLAKNEGLLMELIPSWVNVRFMEKYGDMFLLSGKNSTKTLFDCFVKENPLTLFEIFPYFLRILFSKGKKRSTIATKMWIHFMKKMPKIEEEYDAALAFWGDRTMFYVCDMVRAKKKIAWLHFNYYYPHRDNGIYGHYFDACDKILAVSEAIRNSILAELPEMADKCVTMENTVNPEQIRQMALTGDTFPDTDYTGKRVLTMGRIDDVKGYDLVVPVLKRLREDNIDVRWYVLGDGDGEYRDYLLKLLDEYGVSDMMIFLGTTPVPYAYLNDCHIYAQPSRSEGMPVAVEEAKILHKPILISNYPAAKEQLGGDGSLGVICEANSDSIYEAVKRMLTDGSLCDSLTEKLSKCKFGNADEIKKFDLMMED